MEKAEIVMLVMVILLFAFAAIYVMRVPEQEVRNPVTSHMDSNGNVVYSVNVSDSASIKGGAN